MKKLLFLGIFALFLTSTSIAKSIAIFSELETIWVTDDGVVFRKTQRLKCDDGGEIYLHPNRTCELWDGDRKLATWKYRIDGQEIRIYNGNIEYKAQFQYKSNTGCMELAWLKLEGLTYYAK